MPELPEVETVCRGLEPHLTGKTIRSAAVGPKRLRLPIPQKFSSRLKDHKIERLRRRAKYVLADLSSGETLIIHLGMSGRLTWQENPDQTSKSPHDHINIEFKGGGNLVFNDPRRFGLMTLGPTQTLQDHRLFAHLGPEPLGNRFNEAYLYGALAGRKSSIKACLLDQKTVVGVGNIYASEALFRARISPKRRGSAISKPRIAALTGTIRDVLNDAIAAGGSSLRDYVHADGSLGYFQHGFQVYDRAGNPCPNPSCASGVIVRIVQNNRSTFYCPRCQR